MSTIWTIVEEKLFKKLYPIKTNQELLKMFPNRTNSSINHKASRLKLKKENHFWSKKEIKKLIKLYPIMINQELLKILKGKNLIQIRNKARRLGLKKTKATFIRGRRESCWCKGKTAKTDLRLAEISKKQSGENNPMYGKPPTNMLYYKGGFKEDLKLYVRSTWEANYCRYLQYFKLYYEYEKQTFKIDKLGTTYTPDFYIPEYDTYIEIKGHWYPGQKEKFEGFKKQYPDIKIIVIGKKEYKELERKYSDLIPNWK